MSLNYNKFPIRSAVFELLLHVDRPTWRIQQAKFLEPDVAKSSCKNVTFTKVQFFVCGIIMCACDD